MRTNSLSWSEMGMMDTFSVSMAGTWGSTDTPNFRATYWRAALHSRTSNTTLGTAPRWAKIRSIWVRRLLGLSSITWGSRAKSSKVTEWRAARGWSLGTARYRG